MLRVASACCVVLIATLTACTAPEQLDETGADAGESETESGETTGDEGEPGYPAGPYGTEVGDVVENLSFVDGDDVPITLEELRAAPQPALLLFGTAAWCAVCIHEAETLTLTLAELSALVQPVGVLYEDAFAGPPSAAMVDGYNDAVDAFEFFADPSQRFNEYFDPAGELPRLLLIDTATMTLVYKNQGLDEAALVAAIESI